MPRIRIEFMRHPSKLHDWEKQNEVWAICRICKLDWSVHNGRSLYRLHHDNKMTDWYADPGCVVESEIEILALEVERKREKASQ